MLRPCLLLVSLLALAGCDGSSATTTDEDASTPRADAGSDAATPGTDSGVPRDAAPDAPASQPAIVATTLGTLETDAITALPYGTRGAALLDALTLSTGASASLEDAEGGALDPTSFLDDDARVIVTAGDDERAYPIEMETLENTTVLVVPGETTPRRLDTRYFVNGGAEWIVLDRDSDTHFCMPSDIASGTYGPADGEATFVCLEVMGLDGLGMLGAATNDDDFTVELEVSATAIRGHFHGELAARGEGEPVEIVGWMGSDRVDSGGW
ncbi:hypothetical protein [Sandaracinus amylolyticus]|uniref:hypothetical protein n=1 Tax=Sandaracinus amylolyticus TaxID=927083 RepID=UPI001F300DBD|nr:hypothetical protein [Sandaracinus amylolyticus]UJR79964.1 Hypothetical protein I5071_20060 [Sandaracinus amylolyticus]